MKTHACTADDLVGSYRTFGELGPVYRILRRSSDTKVRVLVIESGEELDYLVERALNDPEAE